MIDANAQATTRDAGCVRRTAYSSDYHLTRPAGIEMSKAVAYTCFTAFRWTHLEHISMVWQVIRTATVVSQDRTISRAAAVTSRACRSLVVNKRRIEAATPRPPPPCP